MTRHLSRPFIVLVAVLAMVLTMGVSPARWHLTSPAHAAGTGSITLAVSSARTVGAGAGFVHEGDPVTAYQWLITSDDVGNPNDGKDNCLPPRGRTPAAPDSSDPGYTNRCQWPSARYTPGNVPVLTHGNQADLAAGIPLTDIPTGNYLISVTADGYKIDGAHFTVTDGGTTNVTVAMQPFPLPLGTIRLRVFNDQAPGRRHLRDRQPGGQRLQCKPGARSHLHGRLHGAHQRRARRGDHRLLRQPAVHDVRDATRTASSSRTVRRSSPRARPAGA